MPEIPLPDHPGSFGAVRLYDVHTGVDLYCPHETEVFAMEDGVVVDIDWFTGPNAGFPWWNDTRAVMIVGESGHIVYGEIQERDGLRVGDEVKAGDLVGTVLTVLKEDKGLPMSMLHVELMKNSEHHHLVWELGQPQHEALLDPTLMLLAIKEKEMKDIRETIFGTVDARIENITPRFLSKCMLKPVWKDIDYKPLDYNTIYIFFGEIPNMPEHCVIMDSTTGKMYSGFHTEVFGELCDIEEIDFGPTEVELWVAEQKCQLINVDSEDKNRPCKPEDEDKCIPCETREEIEEYKKIKAEDEQSMKD